MKLITFLLIAAVTFLSQNFKSTVIHHTDKDEFSKKLNQYIIKLMDSIPDIPAISVAVVKDDEPVFVKAYGFADKENGIKADENTLFYIASSTKSFTALTAALIDEEGVIKLNDPVIKYCDDLNFKEPIPEKIMVRDLLTHTSGLDNDPFGFRVAYSGKSGFDELTGVFTEATKFIDSNYGKYNYSNVGYNIYALLLQHKTGRKWQDEIQSSIFDPLGMKNSTGYISRAASNGWLVAEPYLWVPDKGVTRSWLEKKDNNMQSAGGLFSSSSDMAKWLNMNMNNGRLNGVQVIPEDIIKKCQTGYTVTIRDQQPFTGEGEYGLGWQIGKYKSEKVIYHNGGFPGFATHVSFLPEKKIGVAVMINETAVGNRAIHLIAEYVYNYWLDLENFDNVFDEKLNELINNFNKLKDAVKAASEERSKRVSQLSKPPADYTGNFYNALMGKIEIQLTGEKNDILKISHGNMQCTATHFKEKESVRVELIPGSGEAIYFKLNPETSGVEGLMYNEIIFEKMK